jgi:RsiW-degrading membrane proteinase PrsW (M82 family)
VDPGNPGLVPALLLLGAAVVPVSFVAFVAGRRLRFSVPSWLVALTALLSGVVGVVTAGVLEYETVRELGGLPLVLVGVIEEAAKLVVPVLVLLLLGRRTRPADGLLLGVASGAGFAVLETMGYGFVALLASRGDLGVVDGVLFDRALLSPAAHMAWTGVAAAAVWGAAARGWRPRAVLLALGAFIAVVALHALFDDNQQTWGFAVLALASLGLLAVAAHLVGGRSGGRRWRGAARGPAVSS